MRTSVDAPQWALADVSYRPRGGERDIVHQVSLNVLSRRMTAVLGPNGAGKSTLLRLMLGLLVPERGTVLFEGHSPSDGGRQKLARQIGVVAQGESDGLFSVREIVAMGRYPHLGPWRRERDEDRAAIERAMERCDVGELAHRWVITLSAGEQQRVRLARALAQEPSVLVLDEPTTSLDIRHEMTTFELLGRLRNDGVTVLLATHNLNLASRYADQLVLMHMGRIFAQGSASTVLTPSQVESVYEWPVDIAIHGDGAPQVVPRSAPSFR